LHDAVTVTQLQQELVTAHEMRDEKFAEFQRQTEEKVAAQQAAFDKKVGDGWRRLCFYWVLGFI